MCTLCVSEKAREEKNFHSPGSGEWRRQPQAATFCSSLPHELMLNRARHLSHSLSRFVAFAFSLSFVSFLSVSPSRLHLQRNPPSHLISQSHSFICLASSSNSNNASFFSCIFFSPSSTGINDISSYSLSLFCCSWGQISPPSTQVTHVTVSSKREKGRKRGARFSQETVESTMSRHNEQNKWQVKTKSRQDKVTGKCVFSHLTQPLIRIHNVIKGKDEETEKDDEATAVAVTLLALTVCTSESQSLSPSPSHSHSSSSFALLCVLCFGGREETAVVTICRSM